MNQPKKRGPDSRYADGENFRSIAVLLENHEWTALEGAAQEEGIVPSTLARRILDIAVGLEPAPPRRGRVLKPKMGYIQVRVSDQEWKAMSKAADREGMALRRWAHQVISSALEPLSSPEPPRG